MKKYSEYKESGIEWLSEIPSDWNLCKLKHILEVKDGTHSTPKPIEPSEDAIPLITSKNVKNGIIDFTETTFISKEDHFEINKRSNVEKHDIIMPMIGTVGNPAIVQTDQPFSIKNVALLKNSPLVNIKYINYLFGSAFITTQFDLFSTGGVQNFVSLSILKNLLVPKIDICYQNLIANYLDQKVFRIDLLIEKKKQMIELLKEERAAIINQAVTKGINPDAEMKDSGIEWLGEVPKHWGIKRVKHVLDFYDSIRKPLSSDERGKMQTKQYDYYGASGIIDKVDDYLFEGEYILVGEDGANLLSRSTPLAFKACGKFWVNNHAHILKPKGENILAYYVHLLETLDYTVLVTGSAQPKLTQEALGNQIIIEPTIKDQISIVEFIKDKEKKILSSILHIEKELALIEEYRTALINEAVTGKIKVTESV